MQEKYQTGQDTHTNERRAKIGETSENLKPSESKIKSLIGWLVVLGLALAFIYVAYIYWAIFQ